MQLCVAEFNICYFYLSLCVSLPIFSVSLSLCRELVQIFLLYACTYVNAGSMYGWWALGVCV